MTVCTTCGEEVIEGETRAGAKIALDAEPRPLGMLYISSVDGKVRPWTEHTGRSVPRYQSHSSRCPNSEEKT